MQHIPMLQGAGSTWRTKGLVLFIIIALVIAVCLTISAGGQVVAQPIPANALAANAAVLTPAGTTREFWIAIDEVDWNFAPLGFNKITGEPFDDIANIYVRTDTNRIGSVYRKAIYREYTPSFAQLKPRAPEWQHLGLLGPVIHAEVGDTIIVHFKNNATLRPYSMHPHGVFYQKNSEGAGYGDGTSGANKLDDAVPPGGTHTYTWSVPERAGPGPGDASSVMWMYHSHVEEPADENAGPMGVIIVTAAGKAKPDGSPIDVDREIVNMFKVYDENTSWYLDYNTTHFPTNSVFLRNHPSALATLEADEDFQESNKMHGINGYVFGNLPGLNMRAGERVRWYIMGMGTEFDLHTPHWHGNTLLENGNTMGMRTDVTQVFPATMKVLDMKPDNIGTWLYHCHVGDHITAGMLALYKVDP